MDPLQGRSSYSVERDGSLQALVGSNVPHIMSNINKHLEKVCGKEPGVERKRQCRAPEGGSDAEQKKINWEDICIDFLSKVGVCVF